MINQDENEMIQKDKRKTKDPKRLKKGSLKWMKL
jgi:hypothetical protein